MPSSKDLLTFLATLNASPEFQKHVEIQARREIERIKEETIEEFLTHKVTMEIKAGMINPELAPNLSGTLHEVTNLYSFIGFRQQDGDPTDPILAELKKIRIIDWALNSNNGFRYRFGFPEAKDIFEITPMPWANGRSWAKGIETGISGIGFYLHAKASQSRSGFGLQKNTSKSKPVRTAGRFANVRYISDIISRMKAKLRNLEKQTNR